MATLKADVILQDAICEQIATLAHEMQISQDELVALAIAEFVNKHRAQNLQQSWNEAYCDGLDEDEERTLKGMRHKQRRLIDLEDL
jgi:hypothetical protein